MDITGGEVNFNEGDSWTGAVNLTSGTLNYSDLTNNGALVATDGSLNINSGKLTIDENSQIKSAVTTSFGSATLDITGGEVNFNEGDSWAGAVNLTSGTLNYDYLTENGTLQATGGNLNINSGKLTIDGNKPNCISCNNKIRFSDIGYNR